MNEAKREALELVMSDGSFDLECDDDDDYDDETEEVDTEHLSSDEDVVSSSGAAQEDQDRDQKKKNNKKKVSTSSKKKKNKKKSIVPGDETETTEAEYTEIRRPPPVASRYGAEVLKSLDAEESQTGAETETETEYTEIRRPPSVASRYGAEVLKSLDMNDNEHNQNKSSDNDNDNDSGSNSSSSSSSESDHDIEGGAVAAPAAAPAPPGPSPSLSLSSHRHSQSQKQQDAESHDQDSGSSNNSTHSTPLQQYPNNPAATATAALDVADASTTDDIESGHNNSMSHRSMNVDENGDDFIPDGGDNNNNDSQNHLYVQQQHSQPQEEHLQVIDAELVLDDSTENDRSLFRRQAEKDAEQRLMATAVTAAEAVVVKDEEPDRVLFCRYCMWITGVILFVVVSVVVGVTVGSSSSSSNSNSEPAMNSTCGTAFDLTSLIMSNNNDTSTAAQGELLQSLVSPLKVAGDTTARSGNFSGIHCQSLEYEGGYGQWYSLQGLGRKLRASTCDDVFENKEIEGDTQVLVFSDSCESLVCVAGGDELCGGHGSVGWWASEDVMYYILVRGARASSISNFTLTISALDDNGDCSLASPIVNAASSNGISIFGTTRNDTEEATNNSSTDSVPSCIGLEGSGPSSWYRIEGDDSIKCVSVSVEGAFSTIDFPASMSLYEGDGCENLQCVSGAVENGNEIAWIATADNYLNVQGQARNETGDFILNVRTAPPNSLCDTAEILQVGSSTMGTTTRSCAIFNHACTEDNITSGNLAGVFYSVVADSSNTMEASVCQDVDTTGENTDGTDPASILSVFKATNGCSSLECVETSFVMTDCGSTIQWQSEENVPYIVFVKDFGPRPFNLTVTNI